MHMTILFLSLLLFTVKGKTDTVEGTSPTAEEIDQDKLLIHAKDWFLDTMSTLREELAKGVNQVRNLQNNLQEKSRSEIVDRYDVSKNQLAIMNLPPDCVSLGEEVLQNLQNTNYQGFLQCPNLTIAAQDIVQMCFNAGKLSAQLLMTADELLNGFSDCKSWNPMKFFWCSFQYLKGAIVESFKSLKDVKGFMSSVEPLIDDIKAQYDYCMKQSKRLADVHTVNVLSQVHECKLVADKTL